MSCPARPVADRFWEKVNKTEGCWLWTAALNNVGYGKFMFPKKGQFQGAHRVSWRINFGAIPKGMHVLHRCDNKLCVRPNHLFLGTHLDNMRDMQAKGRRRLGLPLLGERNHRAKLTENQVREIRQRAAAGEMKISIAAAFGICGSTVCNIVNGRAWKHV